MASPDPCPNPPDAKAGAARCQVSFADENVFSSGAFFSSGDLCFPEPREIDPDHQINKRYILLKLITILKLLTGMFVISLKTFFVEIFLIVKFNWFLKC